MTPTQLLLDLAGVLATFDRGPRIAALARLSGLTETEVSERLYGSGFVDTADSGGLDPGGVRAGIVDRLGLTCTAEETDAAWMAAFEEDSRALEVLDRLVEPPAAALLSNNDALVGSLVATHLPGVARRCARMLVAGDLGARKPDGRAYARALAQLGATPEGCLLVDDSEDNVAGARDAGIDAVLYSGPEQLARDLVTRGLRIH